jgi:Kef-type K+ transport system membrane component KefB
MLGAGILDDIFEVIFLSVVLILAHKSFAALAWLPVKLIGFVVVVYVTYKLFPYLLKAVQKERSRIAIFSFILIFALIIAVISTKLELGPIIGAFIAGIIIHLTEHRKYEYKENIKELEAMTFAFIIPFFFINIGLHFDFSIFSQNLWLAAMVLITATVGKLLGALVATPFTDLSLRQTHLIGWGMNSRGAIELVIAEIARINNLIPIEVYSAIVFMAIITTFIFPIALKIIVSKDRKILN